MYSSKEVKKKQESVLELITYGKSLREIVEMGVLKSAKLVFKWNKTDEDFRDNYERAHREQIRYVGDRMRGRFVGLGKEPSREALNLVLAKNDIDKWISARMMPKRWGNNAQTNIQINAEQVVTGINISNSLQDVGALDVGKVLDEDL